MRIGRDTLTGREGDALVHVALAILLPVGPLGRLRSLMQVLGERGVTSDGRPPRSPPI